MPPEVSVPSFKVVIIGDYGVGKTTLSRRFRSWWPPTGRAHYPSTYCVEIIPIQLFTSSGEVTLNCWDTCGREAIRGLRDGYFIQASAAIIMFDVTNRTTYRHVNRWYTDVLQCCGHIPVVICGNKVDAEGRKVKPMHITLPHKLGVPYYDISVLVNYNLDKPFLYICQRLASDPELFFPWGISVAPPATELDEDNQQRYEKELVEMASSNGPSCKSLLDDDELL